MNRKFRLTNIKKIAVRTVFTLATAALLLSSPLSTYSQHSNQNLSFAGLPPLTVTAASQASGLNPNKIVFVSGGDLYTAYADGTGVTLVADHRSGSNIDPKWSPDGSKIAFARNESGNSDIFVMNADGSGLTRLTNSPLNESQPTWSPDGSKIAFVQGFDPTSQAIANLTECFTVKIYIMDANGSNIFEVTDAHGGTDPAWSPDGSKIAFSANTDGVYGIYIKNLKSGAINRLTLPGVEPEGEPAWSPDGSKIAFARNLIQEWFDCGIMVAGLAFPAQSGPSIYVINSDGTGELKVVSGGWNSEPAWSSDGTLLAFTRTGTDGISRIYLANSSSTKSPKQIIPSYVLSSSYSPSWAASTVVRF